LIIDHHDGYLSWAEYERNQRLMADNANSKGLMARGAIRRGETLLAGLLRGGHCGRKLHVAYASKSGAAGRYHCKGAHLNHGGDRCISFGSLRVDQAVGAEVLRLLKPLGVEAALSAVAAKSTEVAEKRRQIELALQQARYEAGHARRQYDAVDPDNRLVAGELERRWNETLMGVRQLEDQIEALQVQKPPALSDAERARLMQLGAELELAWSHPAATTATRKRIVRAVLHELVVRIEEGHVALVLHWQGGDHTELVVKKNAVGRHRWSLDEETEDLIRSLARLLPDQAIASLLNRAGNLTGRNNSWTQSRVCAFRNKHDVAVYRDGERAERGELTLDEAAASLGVSPMTVLRMIRNGAIEGRHLCKGAPWVIAERSVENAKLYPLQRGAKRPLTENSDQKVLAFQ
jgi:excisionase family DNA binding protein